jgi:thiamine kinase-like enzyme
MPRQIMESNKTEKEEVFDSLRVAAERLISATLGGQIHINEIERMTDKGRRNLLLRCLVNPSSGLPSSFILKKVETEIYNPDDAESWDTKRFFNDWMGSQFLSTVSSKLKHSPHFYGGDRAMGFIILEDIQHCASLVEPLLGSDQTQAESALLQYATCLGQLHTDTLGKAAEFAELFKTISPGAKPTRPSTRVTVDIHKHQSILESLGIQPESSYLHDLEAINEALNDPGEFLAYIHADACPDNVLDTGKELRLIDFETGHFGHALIDAAYGRMMFPSCWCANRLPHKMVQQMENTYRAIFSQRCPIAEDDKIFEAALVKACGFWLLNTLTRFLEHALEKDLDFGTSTIRQRILARLESFIMTSQEFNQLPGLCSTSSRLLDLLRQRWLNASPLPFYPAFQKE